VYFSHDGGHEEALEAHRASPEESPDHPVPAGGVQLSMGALPGAHRDQ